MKTKMLFRIDRGGCGASHVYALMPEIPATRDGWRTCTVFDRWGHSAADLLGCIRGSRPATAAERTPLVRELRRRGYDVQVIQRCNHAAALAKRRAKLSL